MEELLRTTDPVLVSVLKALFKDQGITLVELDHHMSILEGSIANLVPRRLMVLPGTLPAARRLVEEAGLGDALAPVKQGRS